MTDALLFGIGLLVTLINVVAMLMIGKSESKDSALSRRTVGDRNG